MVQICICPLECHRCKLCPYCTLRHICSLKLYDQLKCHFVRGAFTTEIHVCTNVRNNKTKAPTRLMNSHGLEQNLDQPSARHRFHQVPGHHFVYVTQLHGHCLQNFHWNLVLHLQKIGLRFCKLKSIGLKQMPELIQGITASLHHWLHHWSRFRFLQLWLFRFFQL